MRKLYRNYARVEGQLFRVFTVCPLGAIISSSSVQTHRFELGWTRRTFRTGDLVDAELGACADNVNTFAIMLIIIIVVIGLIFICGSRAYYVHFNSIHMHWSMLEYRKYLVAGQWRLVNMWYWTRYTGIYIAVPLFWQPPPPVRHALDAVCCLMPIAMQIIPNIDRTSIHGAG